MSSIWQGGYFESILDILNSRKEEFNSWRKWCFDDRKVDGYPFGSWRRGPSGKGPATLSFGQQGSYDRKVTITISGSYTSKWTIGNALGVTIGEKKAYSTNYKVYVPKKKRYQILYRPQYKEYKVVETKFYKIDGYESKTSDR